MVLNRYLDVIRAYEEDKNQTGVLYVYAVILRKVYLYDMPEIDEDDYIYNPDDYARESQRVQSGLKKVFTPNFEVRIHEEK